MDLSAIEFFSGIGGWARAIQIANLKIAVEHAFDINDSGNNTYFHNFHLKPSTKSIVNLTTTYIDSLNVQVWLMSPPCQPFTRNNDSSKRDNRDSRSDPLINLIYILSESKNPPQYLALEVISIILIY